MADSGWLGLVTTVAASVAPLAGVWLGSRLQRGDKAQDRTDAQLRLKREKAEEIFTEIDRIFDLTTEAALAALNESIGESKDGLHDTLANFGRFRALMALYFPELSKEMDEFDRSITLSSVDYTSAPKNLSHEEYKKALGKIKFDWTKEAVDRIFPALQKIRFHLLMHARSLL